MNERSQLAENIKREREFRGWSIEELARRSSAPVASLKRLNAATQQGLHSDTLTRVAGALGVRVETLTGVEVMPAGEATTAALRGLRDVILSPSLVPGLAALAVVDGIVRPAGQLRAAIDNATADYWAGRFDAVVAACPALIAEARLAVAEVGGDEAVANLAMAWELAASVLVFYGQEDLAGIGAERAVSAAAASSDPLLPATMTGTLSWVLLHQGRNDVAEAVALAAAASVEPARHGATRTELAAYGNLLMIALAPRVAQRRDAVDLVEAAAGVAAQLGTKREHVYQASFAQSTVDMQNVYGWTMLKDPGKALKAARAVSLAELPGIRRWRHQLDLAQALTDAGRFTAALNQLKAAAAGSPEWFSRQGIARALVRQIREEQARVSDDVATLARVGLVDTVAPAVRLVI